MRFLKIFIAIISVIASGCASTSKVDNLSATDIRLIWGHLFAGYDIHPFFPLGGAGQPGDIYQICLAPIPNTTSSGTTILANNNGASVTPETYIFKQRKVAALDFSNQLKAYYHTRYRQNFSVSSDTPASSTPGAGVGAAGKAPVAGAGAAATPTAVTIFDRVDPSDKELPVAIQAGFPDLSSAYQHTSNFGLSFPEGVSETKLGITSASYRWYSVHIEGAEVLTVLQFDAASATKEWFADGKNTLLLAEIKDPQFCGSASNVKQKVIVIGSTYYARTIVAGEGDSKASAYQMMQSLLLGAGTQATTSSALGGATLPVATAPVVTLPAGVTSPIIITPSSPASAIPTGINPAVSIGGSTSNGYSVAAKFLDSKYPIAFGAKYYEINMSTGGLVDPLESPGDVIDIQQQKPRI